MSRQRGRTTRDDRLRVRTVRRTPIDAEALAQAALENAAMQHRGDPETSARDEQVTSPPQLMNEPKDPRDDLA
jgi:hypothetical protein